MEKRNNTVYKTTCNNKFFIGVTDNWTPNFLGNGVYRGTMIKFPKTPLQHAIKKNGWRSCKIEQIASLPKEEAFALQATLFNVEDPQCYNCVEGGLSTSPIWQMLEGKEPRLWNSILEASEYYGVQIIPNTKRCSSYWSLDKEIKPYKLSENILCYDTKGNFICRYESKKDLLDKFSSTQLNIAIAQHIPLSDFYFLKEDINIWNVIKTNDVYNISNKSLLYNDIWYVNRSRLMKDNKGLSVKKIKELIKQGIIKQGN